MDFMLGSSDHEKWVREMRKVKRERLNDMDLAKRIAWSYSRIEPTSKINRVALNALTEAYKMSLAPVNEPEKIRKRVYGIVQRIRRLGADLQREGEKRKKKTDRRPELPITSEDDPYADRLHHIIAWTFRPIAVPCNICGSHDRISCSHETLLERRSALRLISQALRVQPDRRHPLTDALHPSPSPDTNWVNEWLDTNAHLSTHRKWTALMVEATFRDLTEYDFLPPPDPYSPPDDPEEEAKEAAYVRDVLTQWFNNPSVPIRKITSLWPEYYDLVQERIMSDLTATTARCFESLLAERIERRSVASRRNGLRGGVNGGRPRYGDPRTPDKPLRAQARALHEQGKSQREIARELGIGTGTVCRWLKEAITL